MKIEKPTGSVVIIGAGTQGRRLAYMVCGINWSDIEVSVILTNAKWSSKGGTVCLVDLQEQQLQDGLQYVEKLRAETSDHREWGRIETSHPSSLDILLSNAWLVVEVWRAIILTSLLTYGIKIVCSRELGVEAKSHNPA